MKMMIGLDGISFDGTPEEIAKMLKHFGIEKIDPPQGWKTEAKEEIVN